MVIIDLVYLGDLVPFQKYPPIVYVMLFFSKVLFLRVC